MTTWKTSHRWTTALLASALAIGGGALAESPATAADSTARPSPTAQSAKIMSDSTDSGAFGISEALTADGTTAIIGAQQHNGNRGGAYVFQLVGGVWTKTADLTRADLQFGDSYGNSVAISADGSWAMVGEVGWKQLTGRVFVFHHNAKGWHLVSRLTAPHNETFTHFGDSISMDSAGDAAVIGRLGAAGFVGRAYVVQRGSDGSWATSQQLTPHSSEQLDFGTSVSLSADGSTALVGANTFQAGVGAAYVFRDTSGRWVRDGRLTSRPHQDGAYFGTAVSLNADGTSAAVGAVYEAGGNGAAYIFTRTDAGWTQTARLAEAGSSQFGNAVALDAAGTTAVVGAEASQVTGSAFVYSTDGTGWTKTATLGPDVTDQALFGVAVAINPGGDTTAVGAAFDDDNVPGQSGYGAVYVFPTTAP